MRHLLERLASTGPVVLALEDVHWADPTSLQLAEQLLGLTEEAAVLLVITQRPDPDHASWALREIAARQLAASARARSSSRRCRATPSASC